LPFVTTVYDSHGGCVVDVDEGRGVGKQKE